MESLNYEAKQQILSVYNEVGAAGLQIEVEEQEEQEEEAEVVTEVDKKFFELCQAEPQL